MVFAIDMFFFLVGKGEHPNLQDLATIPNEFFCDPKHPYPSLE